MAPRTMLLSDPHFGHANVIRYCDRPYANVDEMNLAILKNCQTDIRPEDQVYILGDLAMNIARNAWLVEQIPGHKHLILGNHDHFRQVEKRLGSAFEWIRDYAVVKPVEAPDERLVLLHFPIEVWNGRHRGWIHAHGHSHGNTPHQRLLNGRVDVGVDCWNMHPVTYADAKARALSYAVGDTDHHKDREEM